MSGRRSRKTAQRIRRRVLTIVPVVCILAVLFLAFQLKTVIVAGNIHNAPAEITQLLLEKPVLGNTLLAALFNSGRTIESAGFVDKLKVQILDRNRIRVIVTERKFAGRIFSGGKWYYFDASGRVMAESETASEGDGIPPVEGLLLNSEIELLKTLPLTNTRVFSMMGMLLNRMDVMPEMTPDKVVFDADGGMSLVYGDVTVLLGTGEKLEMRLRQLSGVLDELKNGYSGTLHLESYDGSQSGLIFDPL